MPFQARATALGLFHGFVGAFSSADDFDTVAVFVVFLDVDRVVVTLVLFFNTVGDRNPVVVGVYFAEGEETVTVAAIFDESGLQ